MNEPIRIVLVEDQTIIRQGLKYILDAQPDMKVVGQAIDGKAAIQIAQVVAPDVVLMDIRMPGMDGIEATREILSRLPSIRVVLLTTFDLKEYVFDGIRAGAVGYILKDAETSELLDGIRAAHRGGIIFRSANSSEAMFQAIQAGQASPAQSGSDSVLLEPLTEREHEVLQQMALGLRNAEIAQVLSVSEGTIKTHVHRILQKLGTNDRTQAVVIALRQHIVH